MLEFQLSNVIFTILNLLILYFFLRKFLFARVNAILEQRAKLIQEQLDDAQQEKAQAQALQEEYEEKLSSARQEATQLVEDAKVQAQRAYESRMTQAEHDARRFQAEAEARSEVQRREMLRGIRQEVARLAVLAAAQVSCKELDQASDRAIVEEFLAEAGDRT